MISGLSFKESKYDKMKWSLTTFTRMVANLQFFPKEVKYWKPIMRPNYQTLQFKGLSFNYPLVASQ